MVFPLSRLLRTSLLGAVLCVPLSGCSCSDETGGTPGGQGGTGSDACAPGGENCDCRPGNDCDAPLVCESGTCVQPASAGLTVSDRNARGCEVLLTEDKAKVSGVSFGDGVKGTFIRESPKVSLSFIATADDAIPSGAVSVQFESGASDGLIVKTVKCNNKDGAPLSGVEVTLKD